MDHNQIYVPCRARAESEMCEGSEKFILWKLIRHTEIIFLQVKPLCYLTHRQPTLFVAPARKVRGVRFKETPTNGTIHNPPIKTKLRTFVTHAQKVRGLELRESPSVSKASCRQKRRSFLGVKCSLLLTNLNQTYIKVVQE
jgi:hypothetical protein